MTKAICPRCRTVLEAPEGAYGKRVNCPNCGAGIIIQSAAESTGRAQGAQHSEDRHVAVAKAPDKSAWRRCGVCWQRFGHAEKRYEYGRGFVCKACLNAISTPEARDAVVANARSRESSLAMLAIAAAVVSFLSVAVPPLGSEPACIVDPGALVFTGRPPIPNREVATGTAGFGLDMTEPPVTVQTGRFLRRLPPNIAVKTEPMRGIASVHLKEGKVTFGPLSHVGVYGKALVGLAAAAYAALAILFLVRSMRTRLRVPLRVLAAAFCLVPLALIGEAYSAYLSVNDLARFARATEQYVVLHDLPWGTMLLHPAWIALPLSLSIGALVASLVVFGGLGSETLLRADFVRTEGTQSKSV